MPTSQLARLVLLLIASCAPAAETGAESGSSTGPRRSRDRAADPRPNIVLLLTDDAGFGDVGCYGNADVVTPNLDQLAADGIRFLQGYVASPACSPSRAGIFSGRHPAALGHEHNINKIHREGEWLDQVGLPVGTPTIADYLGAAGYRTAFIGKWHLGSGAAFHPLERGFDEFFGFLHGPTNSFCVGPAKGEAGLLRGREAVTWEGHLSDTMTHEAVEFVRRERDAPFFLTLSHNLPHMPTQPKAEHLEATSEDLDERRRPFVAAMRTLDESVGAVLAALEENGLEDNTIVLFASDNGATTRLGGSNGSLRGGKGMLLEGGLRVPLLVRWPARLPKGTTYGEAVSTLDLVPTCLAAAGIEVPAAAELDGVDLLPFLAGRAQGAPHETLYWRFGNRVSCLRERWKLIVGDGEPQALYDLDADLGEATNLLAEEPDVVAELLPALRSWDAGLPAPRWLDRVQEKKSDGR